MLFLIFFLGVSLTLNIVSIFLFLIAIRKKFIDFGNIFKFFSDDKVASNVVNKTILDDDY